MTLLTGGFLMCGTGALLTGLLSENGGEVTRVNGCVHVLGTLMIIYLLIHWYMQTQVLRKELLEVLAGSQVRVLSFSKFF